MEDWCPPSWSGQGGGETGRPAGRAHSPASWFCNTGGRGGNTKEGYSFSMGSPRRETRGRGLEEGSTKGLCRPCVQEASLGRGERQGGSPREVKKELCGCVCACKCVCENGSGNQVHLLVGRSWGGQAEEGGERVCVGVGQEMV